jgi:hypothetical protein
MGDSIELETRAPYDNDAQNPFATRPNSTATSHSLPELSGDLLPPPTLHDPPSHASSLPLADGGKDAWLFLLGATVMETLIWGLPFSVGVLHAYWTNELFANQGGEGTITLAATLQSGLMYISTGLLGP